MSLNISLFSGGYKKAVIVSFMLTCSATQAFATSTLMDPPKALAKIDAQNQYFGHAHVVQSGKNVYTAVGFHGATTSMIVGDDGVIMIDALYGPESAGDAMKALRKASGCDLPVKAIIYTHSHDDHIGGASAYITNETDVRIIGPTGMSFANGVDKTLLPLMKIRGPLQFGRHLPKEEQTNRGVAPANTYDADAGKGFLKPTEFIDQPTTLNIAGVEIYLRKAPGETNDAMFVWLPQSGVLFTGDNFYQSFPNLYAIRGTPYRDVRVWAASLDGMATLNAKYLVPGHTSPIHGQENVKEALTGYARAIRNVFDQTVAGMNRLEDPDTIAQSVKLDPDLVNKPWLSEVYGNVENASRAIYAGLVGWFDGNPVHLHPLSKMERAEEVLDLCQGVANAIAQIRLALKEGRTQWAFELADMISHAKLSAKDHQQVIKLQIQACRELAKHESNAPNRNYYLGWAHRLEASLK